jgi:predicted metal-binding protein
MPLLSHIHEWAILPTASLSFSPALLDYCKANACGNYNKSWTCPPNCGSIEEQQKKILSHDNVLVFSTKHSLEDSFDYEGMTKGRDLHMKISIEIKKTMGNPLVYGAGDCPVCRNKNKKNGCFFPDPCPFPKEMIGSIEAAGIDVAKLCKTAGITYKDGKNTVTFFTIVLF